MSIQTKAYTSKKTGKTTTKYYAVVFSTKENKLVWGSGFKTEKEAKRDELRLIEEIESEQHIYVKMSFEEVANQWLESSKKEYANSTYKTYEWFLGKYIMPVFGDIAVNKILPTHVQKYTNELNKQYAPATVNKILNLLSVIMDFSMFTLKSINSNPCKTIKRSRISNRKTSTWSIDDVGYFLCLNIVKSSSYYEMLVLSFTTAMRPSEVCGLAISDLTEQGILTLNRGLDKYGVLSDLKTSSSHRAIVLSPEVQALLRKSIFEKKKNKLKYGELFTDNDFLFTHEDGSKITPDVYSKAFKKLIKKHNENIDKLIENKKISNNDKKLEDIRLYDIRHSFATNLLADGDAPIKVISEVMGHSNVKTTLHNYAHVTQTMHAKTLNDYSSKILSKDSVI